MIWFILATFVGALGGYLYSRGEDNHTGEAVGVGLLSLLGAAVAALIINALFGLLPSQQVIVVDKPLAGPVVVQQSMDTRDLFVQVHTTDRVTYTNADEGGRSDGYDLVFENSQDRRVLVKDYRPYNLWLTVCNYKNNDLVVKIPDTETVKLAQR